MPLDPQVTRLLEAFSALGGPPVPSLTPEQNRARYAEVVAARRGPDYVPEPVDEVRDVDAGGVPARLYRPADATGLLVFFHGGGWVVGGLDSHDGICRTLANRGGFAVLSVDYRLSPEHPFPAPYGDCLAATRWALAELAGPVAVGGDSAGGNLAAVMATALPSELAGQVLVYPAVDAVGEHPSQTANGRGYFLEHADMRWYWEQYAGQADRSDPRLSPLLAPSLAGLPPAVVATAEYDPLRDEGDAYAARLAADGVPVTAWCEPGLVHGFLASGGTVDAADRAVTKVAAATAALLRSSSSG